MSALWTWLIPVALAAGPQAEPAPPIQPGAYVMVVEVGSTSKVPVAGTANITTRSLLQVDLSQDPDGGWTQTQKLCAVEVESDTRATTILPQTFIDAVPDKAFPVRLIEGASGWSYAADPGPNHIGYDPETSGGVVPTRRNDPGVVDFEGDGHPGATILLNVPVLGDVRMYITQFGWSQFRGEVTEGGVEGKVLSLAAESRTLGASIGLFAADATITPVPERSRFQLRPIPAGTRCENLAPRWGRGFEPPSLPGAVRASVMRKEARR